MNQELIAHYDFGDMRACYVRDLNTDAVELQLIPLSLAEKIAVHRKNLKENEWIARLPGFMSERPARKCNSLVQVHRRGDSYNPNDVAMSLLHSGSTQSLVFQEQNCSAENGTQEICTVFELPGSGLLLTHFLLWKEGRRYVESRVEVLNRGNEPQTLEQLSSFSLGGFSPFDSSDSRDRLRFHRFRSFWSREARHLSETPEELNLSLPWIQASFAGERFGHVGSWPCSGWFPFVAVEDFQEGVFWGAQLGHPGSWQMEIYRRDDCFDLAGGLADRNFGHWWKQLEPGERFETPAACLSVSQGSLDDLTDRMLEWQEDALQVVPEEKSLPVMVNDFCIHWGATGHNATMRLLDRIKQSPVRYLVIDAGWYKPEENDWNFAQGDWQPSAGSFPGGIGETAQAIRDAGLVPGIWFEMEVVCPDAAAYCETDHMLKLNGFPITVGARRFWDFRDSWVINYLSERLIGFIREHGFGYLKVDYNASIGLGVDGEDSPGENLRQHLAGVQQFFRKIRTSLPELVIENCASGGMRLEPSMMALASVGSFSDCHETVEGPVIAANMHRMILPRQSLIWSTLSKDDSEKDLHYALSGSFLGRMCLSGQLMELSDKQWDVAVDAMKFYERIRHIIAKGCSVRLGPPVQDYRNPEGWQCVVRFSETEDEILLVAHCFEKPWPEKILFEIPESIKGGKIAIQDFFAPAGTGISVKSDSLIEWVPADSFSSLVAHLRVGSEECK